MCNRIIYNNIVNNIKELNINLCTNKIVISCYYKKSYVCQLLTCFFLCSVNYCDELSNIFGETL